MDKKFTAKVYVREDQSFHEVPITSSDKPRILPELKAKWQDTLNILRQTLDVAVTFVMAIGAESMRVFLQSWSEAKQPQPEPQPSETEYPLGTGLYCESVVGTDSQFFVEDAGSDPLWRDNIDMQLGLRRYYGSPLHWPDGSFFGTLCVLDPRSATKDAKISRLLSQFASSMEKDMACLCLMQKLDEKAKRAESDLRSSRRMYTQATDKARLAVWEYDPQTRHISLAQEGYTRTLCQQIGIPMETGRPEDFALFVDERDRAAFLQMYRNIDNGAASAECEFRCVNPSAGQRWQSISCTSIYDENGVRRSVYGLGQDITDRKRERDRFSVAFSSPKSLGSFRHNLTKNWTGGGRSRYPHVLRQQESGTVDGYIQAIADSMEDPGVRAAFLERVSCAKLLKAFWEGTTQITFDYPVRHPDKSLVWARGTVNMFQNEETGDVEAVTHALDITEEKQSEKVIGLITKNEFDYIGLINASRHTFKFLTRQPRISFPELGREVGYELCCQYVSDHFISPQEKKHFASVISLDNILAHLRSDGQYTDSHRRTETDGSVRYEQLNYNWIDEISGLILVTRTDVTATYRRNLAQLGEIEEARLRAEKANEAKSTFLSSMSHDLRTPLNAIIGFTDLALRQSDPASRLACLEKIKISGTLLANLVNDTLELSRIESGKMDLQPEAVDGKQMVSDITMAVRPNAEQKKISLTTDLAVLIGTTLWVDRLKVQKVLLNLLTNAVKYTPEGGTVSLSVSTINPPRDGCNYRFIVADNGIGISEEFQRQMFEPFTQERRREAKNVTGTGLGLSIVKRIVELMGGTVTVQSQIGKGSTFTVDLPMPSAQAGKQQIKDEADIGTLAGRRVLLCEDNELNSEIAEILLREKGIQVDSATDGQEGVKLFSTAPAGHYDAILMDMRMPVMNGIEATRAIRALNRRDAEAVPIIAMSADAFEEDQIRARENGMNGYITKPIVPEQMYRTLAREIRNCNRRPHDQAVKN